MSKKLRRSLSLARLMLVSHLMALLVVSPLALPLRDGAESAEARAVGRSQARKTQFTDDEIIEGFLRTAFGAEYHLAGRVDRIRKYDRPVRIAVGGISRPDRHTELARIVSDIARRVRHLDIALADEDSEANVDVVFVRERELPRTLARLYGRDRARDITESLDPQCLSGFRKNDAFEIEHSDVILSIDTGEFTFRDCAYEELLQSLGPINDTDLPWTMFNDDVRMGHFGMYDQYLLNLLYDPRVRPGMTITQVKDLLPQILPEVRAWVEANNNSPR